mgnify:FL=1
MGANVANNELAEFVQSSTREEGQDHQPVFGRLFEQVVLVFVGLKQSPEVDVVELQVGVVLDLSGVAEEFLEIVAYKSLALRPPKYRTGTL